MPNQISNTTENNNNTIYSDMDEALTKPPAGIVRYGSVTLLFLLLIVCGTSFFVKYDEGIHAAAYLKVDTVAEIKLPQTSSVLQAFLIHNDTIVQKDDKILMVKTSIATDTIVAPFAGKIICQRKLQQGGVTDAGKLLFTIIGGQNEFKLKITMAQKEAGKVLLGQKLQITVPDYQQNTNYRAEGEIISMPYIDSASLKITVDAIVTFKEKNKAKKELYYILPGNYNAYIITQNKSLAAAFFGL